MIQAVLSIGVMEITAQAAHNAIQMLAKTAIAVPTPLHRPKGVLTPIAPRPLNAVLVIHALITSAQTIHPHHALLQQVEE